jgi:hypothetical protein
MDPILSRKLSNFVMAFKSLNIAGIGASLCLVLSVLASTGDEASERVKAVGRILF